MRTLFLFFLFLILALAAGEPASAAERPLVSLPGGSYRAVPPPGWDGASPLPLVLYLHGYRQTSATVLEEPAVVAAVASAGALLVVPDGADGGWSHVGAPRQGRDDRVFLHAVVADAERRWPVDRDRVIASGFSIGASMVWDLACHSAEGFTAFLPISGDFWQPYPETCDSGPVNLRHVHGWSDTTFPMSGRTIRSAFQQGDLMTGFAILRRTDGCPAQPDEAPREGELYCQVWSSCVSGRRLELCLHPGGHEVIAAHLSASLAWALHLAR